MAKVLVTGALGNVGSYVAHYLIAAGQEVVVADINLGLLQKNMLAKPTLFFLILPMKQPFL